MNIIDFIILALIKLAISKDSIKQETQINEKNIKKEQTLTDKQRYDFLQEQKKKLKIFDQKEEIENNQKQDNNQNLENEEKEDNNQNLENKEKAGSSVQNLQEIDEILTNSPSKILEPINPLQIIDQTQGLRVSRGLPVPGPAPPTSKLNIQELFSNRRNPVLKTLDERIIEQEKEIEELKKEEEEKKEEKEKEDVTVDEIEDQIEKLKEDLIKKQIDEKSIKIERQNHKKQQKDDKKKEIKYYRY